MVWLKAHSHTREGAKSEREGEPRVEGGNEGNFASFMAARIWNKRAPNQILAKPIAIFVYTSPLLFFSIMIYTKRSKLLLLLEIYLRKKEGMYVDGG